MEAVEQETYRGHTIRIIQDESPESPREWDNLGKMLCFHNRYDLGDEHKLSADEIKEFAADKEIISLSLYLYDHSGITMNTTGFSCPWDSGMVGYITVCKDTVRKEYGVRNVTKAVLDKVLTVLRGEVETYDKYLTGQVYGFTIEDADHEHVDSCWGFYDEPSEMIAECKLTVDAHIEAINKEKHYPKVEVFVTKGFIFRARIRESVEQPSFEVSVGGEEWGKGKGKNHEQEIKDKAGMIIGSLIGHYEKDWGGLI